MSPSRGRHPTANVPGDSAVHRGTAAAATTSASVRRSMSCIQERPTEGVRPNARENGQIRTLEQAFGLPEVLVAVSTSRLSCKRAGKTRTLMPVWDSSGESRTRPGGASGGLRREEDALAEEQPVLHGVSAVRREFLELKARRADPITQVAPIEADVIVLPEVQVAVRLAHDVGVLVGVVPALDDRHHEDGPPAGLQDAEQLRERLSVVDVLEHVEADDR